MSIAYLPLDDRPLNYAMIARAAEVSPIPLVLPPRELVGTREGTPSQLEVAHWLAANCDQETQLVLSVDALLHGGLIQARKAHTEQQRIDTGLSLLGKLAERAGSVRAHFIWKRLWGNIFRTAELENMGSWQALSRELADLVRSHGSAEEFYEQCVASGCAVAGWPQDDLMVLAARRLKQLQEARAVLKLCDHYGIALHIAVEDSVADGVQGPELEWLLAQTPGERISVADGGDEAGAVLLAGAVAQCMQTPSLPVVAHGLRDEVATYESRSVRQNLRILCSLANATLVGDASGFALYVQGKPAAADPYLGVVSGEHHVDELGQLLERLTPLRTFDEERVTVDLTTTNGVNPELLNEFLANPRSPLAIVQCNTASNRIGQGLLLAQVLRHAASDGAVAKLVVAQFVEDLLYNAYLRTWVVQRHGGLEPPDERVLAVAENSLCRIATTVAQAKFTGAKLWCGTIMEVREVSLRLPWRRWFEAEARADAELK